MTETITPRSTYTRPDTAPAPSSSPAIADPGPLGLAAFALTTFVLTCVNTGWLKEGTETVVIGLALFYGGLGQLLAGMWEFRKNNTFGAVALSSYGAFWLSFAGILFFYKPVGVTVSQANHAIGFYLIAWAIFTGYMTVSAGRVSVAVLAVFASLTATFILLGIANLAVHPGVLKAGGYLGIITAALAWYASFAGVTNATWKRTVLPTWPAKAR
jgi:succinate-acetate transporter protein